MRTIICSVLVAAAVLANPALAASRVGGDIELQTLIAGRVAEDPVACIDLGYVTNVTAITGTGLVYRIANRMFVNVPEDPSRIRRDDVLVTDNVGARLCEHDAVRLLDWSTRIPHGYAMLGKFVPYSEPPKAH